MVKLIEGNKCKCPLENFNMISTLDRGSSILCFQQTVTDDMALSTLRKENRMKIFIVDFVKIYLYVLLIHLVIFNPFYQTEARRYNQRCLHPLQRRGTAPKIFLQKIHGLFHIHSTFDTTLKKPTKVSLFQCTFL